LRCIFRAMSTLTLLLSLLACADKQTSDTAEGATPAADDTADLDGSTDETVITDPTDDTGTTPPDDTSSPDDTGGAGETGDTAPVLTYPDLPTAGCGAPAYEWLPLEGMGAVIDFEKDETLSWEASVIDFALSAYGLEAYGPVPYGVDVYRVRYVTQDRGQQVEATGLVSVPVMDEPADVPLLLYAHPTMGFTGECAPSATGLEGAAFNILFAAMGFAVATPDYLGMNGWGEPSDFLHPYALGEPTAIASLDAMRAMLQFADSEATNARPDPSNTVLWGASEGGFAALWADRYAPYYAPEFGIQGVVAAVPPTDLLGLAEVATSYVSDTTWALAGAFSTVNPWYGEPAPLSGVLTDEEPYYFATNLPLLLEDTCDDYDAAGSISVVEELYQADVAAALASGDYAGAEPFSCYLKESSLSDERIPLASDTPVFIILAENDTLVHATPTRDDIPRLCEMGYRIQHLECAGAGHVDGAVDSLPNQWDWILDRVAGLPLEEACVINPPEACVGIGLEL